MKRTTLLTLQIIVIFSISGALSADTVFLKNGKSVTGQVINQSPTDIQLKVDGKIQKILKRDIRRIQFVDPEIERQRLEEERRQREEAERLKKEEEARRAEELEKQRQADEKRRLEEAKKDEEERLRLAEEERKKIERERERLAEEQERAERERLRSEKRERIQHLAKRHHITAGIGYGPSGEKTYAEDYLRGFNKFFDLQSKSITSFSQLKKKSNSTSINLHYSYDRYLLRMNYSSNRLRTTSNLFMKGEEGDGSVDHPFKENDEYVLSTYDPIANETINAKFGWILLLKEQFEADVFFGTVGIKVTSPSKGNGFRSIEDKLSGSITNLYAKVDRDMVMKLYGPQAGLSLLYRMQSLPLDIRFTLGLHKTHGIFSYFLSDIKLNDLHANYLGIKFDSPLRSNGTLASIETVYRLPKGFSVLIGLFHEKNTIRTDSHTLFTLDGQAQFAAGQWQPQPKGSQGDGPPPGINIPFLNLGKPFEGSEISWGMRIGIEKRFDL